MITRFPKPPDGFGYIYALSDARKPTEIRYIGKTEKALKSRLKEHVVERNRFSNHRLNWIRKLWGEGLKPIIWPLEVCWLSQWEERERYWIAFFKPIGILTNATEGGDGNCSKWNGAKISAAKKGKKMTPEAKEAWRKSGFVERTIARNKNGWSPETRTKILAAIKGRKMTPAQRAAFDARQGSPGTQMAQEKFRNCNELRKKPVVGDNGRKFESLAEACRQLGVKEFQLKESIRHNWRCRGVRWTVLEPSKESASI